MEIQYLEVELHVILRLGCGERSKHYIIKGEWQKNATTSASLSC